MADLPGDIWGVIARVLLPKTPLAPVSRGLYAATITAISDAADEYATEDAEFYLDVHLMNDHTISIAREYFDSFMFDIIVYMSASSLRFDLRGVGKYTYQKAPGLLSVRGIGVDIELKNVVVSPLLCNYVISRHVSTDRGYPEWICKYAATCTATAAKFAQNI